MKKDKLVSEMLGEEAALTPSDIYSVEFKSAVLGGYDKEEVDAFLERVADVLESIGTKLRETRERNDELKTELSSLKEMEAALRNALTSSQKFSENMVATARQEAEAILAEARAAHRQAQLAQREYPDALRAEIGALEAARDRLRHDLRAILNTHTGLLEQVKETPRMPALAPLPAYTPPPKPHAHAHPITSAAEYLQEHGELDDSADEDEALASAFGTPGDAAPAWAMDDVEQAEAMHWEAAAGDPDAPDNAPARER